MTNANLSLLDATAQFLGGLKLAMSQNLQARFIDEFRQSLHELTRRQIDFVRQQSRVRIALSTLPALAARLAGSRRLRGVPPRAGDADRPRRHHHPDDRPGRARFSKACSSSRMRCRPTKRPESSKASSRPCRSTAARKRQRMPLPEGAIKAENVSFRHALRRWLGARRSGRQPDDRAGRDCRHHRTVGRRQDDFRRPSGRAVPAAAGTDFRRGNDAGRCDAGRLARSRQLHFAGSFPVSRYGSPQSQLGEPASEREGHLGGADAGRRRRSCARDGAGTRHRRRRARHAGLRRRASTHCAGARDPAQAAIAGAG